MEVVCTWTRSTLWYTDVVSGLFVGSLTGVVCMGVRSVHDTLVEGPDSLSGYLTGTVCVWIMSALLYVGIGLGFFVWMSGGIVSVGVMGTGPGLFIGVPAEDTPFEGPVDPLVRGPVSLSRHRGWGRSSTSWVVHVRV